MEVTKHKALKMKRAMLVENNNLCRVLKRKYRHNHIGHSFIQESTKTHRCSCERIGPVFQNLPSDGTSGTGNNKNLSHAGLKLRHLAVFGQKHIRMHTFKTAFYTWRRVNRLHSQPKPRTAAFHVKSGGIVAVREPPPRARPSCGSGPCKIILRLA